MPDNMMFAALSMSSDGPLVSTAVGAGLPLVVANFPPAAKAPPAANKPAMNPT
jgi:hypothetical protein